MAEEENVPSKAVRDLLSEMGINRPLQAGLLPLRSFTYKEIHL
jgi:hypothetical protein